MNKLMIYVFPILILNINGDTKEIPTWAKEKQPVKIGYYVGLGSSIPLGDLNDRWNNGLHIYGRIDFMASPVLSIWAGAEYHRFGFEDDEETPGFKSINFAGDLKLNFASNESAVNPYFFGGAGIATVKKSDYFYYRPTDTSGLVLTLGEFPTKSYPLVELGGGVEFRNFFFQARYVSIFSNDTAVSYIPVTVGAKF